MTTKTEKKPAANAFAAAGDMLGLGLGAAGGGVDALFGLKGTGNEYEATIDLSDIEIGAQARTELEDEEQKLEDLGKSLRVRQLQNIVVCLNFPGREQTYRLIAGERRVRAAKIEGLPTLRATVMELTEEEAEEAQFTENIHRKNLTQIEEAKQVKRDLAKLDNNIDALLAKYEKSRPWLSKMLALLDLPEQAKRVVTQGLTADVEVISAVRQIEKVAPAEAKALVDKMAANKGTINVREETQRVKDAVKPSKAKAAAKKAPEKAPEKAVDGKGKEASGSVATPKNKAHEEPSEPKIFTAANAKPKSLKPEEILAGAYGAIFDGRTKPATVLEGMTDEEREKAEGWLRDHFEAGKQMKDIGRTVINGMRTGRFSTDGEGALALVALLNGAEGGVQFDMLNIFGAVK